MSNYFRVAFRAAAEEVPPSPHFDNESDYEAAAESIITKALPHLRRAIIQELADEAERESDTDPMDITGAFSALPWLRAKLKEAENND